MHILKSRYPISSLRFCAILLALASAGPAQTFDTSGDGMLKGSYYVRELLVTGQTSTAASSVVSVIGTVTFDGNGAYTFSGQQSNSSGAKNTSLSLSGTYQVSSSGFLIMQSIAAPGDSEYGGVSGAIGPDAFSASATEKNNLSIMVGIPAAGNVSNSSLSGSYSAASLDFTNADSSLIRDASFNFNADGAGNFGNISVTGMAANLGNTAIAQTVSGATYSLSGNGGGTANFGSPSQNQLISGAKDIFISADGNVVLGGAPDGFDFLIAIRSLGSPASNSSTSGFYYVSGLAYANISGLPLNVLTAYSGSMNATGSGLAISHNRFQSSAGPVFDNTFSSAYTVASDGTFQLSNSARYTLGASGQAFIATGTQGIYSIGVGFHAQQFAGSGVYLNPLGIVNAGSYAPATNPVAPGEIVAIFGTGLSTSTATAATLPLPTNLGGVSVSINGQNVPLFYVSPTQITAMVPYSISAANGVNYATFKVTNNSTTSNAVTMYVRNTSPGIFSLSQNGVGPAAVQHADYSVVSSSNPAHPGETVMIYLGGLGAVSPAVQEGNAAPANPPSSVTGSVSVSFNSQASAVPDFAGLTPTAAGLYQLNVKIPSTLSAGDALLDVITADGSSSEATIRVGP